MGLDSKRIIKLQLVLYFLLSLLAFSVQADAEIAHTELKANAELKNEKIETLSDYKYYKFTVDSNYKGHKDIAIRTSLTEEVPWANPDIFLAKESEVPTNSTHQIACQSFGEDICTINKKEIKAGETWYVGVTCSLRNTRNSQ